jgi:hypothetical protein
VLPEKSPMLMLTAREEGICKFCVFNRRVVDFESNDDVANAIRKLDGIELKGKRVKLSEDAVRHHWNITYLWLECNN